MTVLCRCKKGRIDTVPLDEHGRLRFGNDTEVDTPWCPAWPKTIRRRNPLKIKAPTFRVLRAKARRRGDVPPPRPATYTFLPGVA